MTINDTQNFLIDSELGKKSAYEDTYNPDKLYAIERAGKRQEIGISTQTPPFIGFDCWNHYEVSWLNQKGKPEVVMAEIYYDCHSPRIIESKSMKLYFNSFNNTKFNSLEDVTATIQHDLEKAVGSEVTVVLKPLNTTTTYQLNENFSGFCLDELDIECDCYTVNSTYLVTHEPLVEETVYSNLLKSNCLVTHQPDWGSVQIHYKGLQLDHAGLLRYIVSFRNHNEFHEQCIERIFIDIMNHCKPQELTVYGRYTRRGGLDINPYRSTQPIDFTNINQRLVRQ